MFRTRVRSVPGTQDIFLAVSAELEAKHFQRLGEYGEAAKHLETAAACYQQTKETYKANRTLASAHQARAMSYKEDATRTFAEVASEFLLAKENFELVGSVEAAKVCESDYCKNMGLDAKSKGLHDEAI